MLIDARTLPDHKTIEADLCIIGAGVAGLTLAREFAGTSTEVVILESGGDRPAADTQNLARGDVTGQSYFALDDACKRAVGGTSWAWNIDRPDGATGVRLRSLDAIDFMERPEIPYSGWPLRKADLDPYYTAAHALFNLGPYDYTASHWGQPSEAPPISFPDTDVETTIYQFGDASLFRDQYGREAAAASNVRLLTNATTTELTTNDAATWVSGVEVKTLTGRSLRVTASTVIVAAGGIQTPRLLLLSNRRRPNGLGNDHDLVGRFFMEHLHTSTGYPSGGWFIPSDPEQFQRYALYRMHKTNGTVILGYLKLSNETLRREGLPNYCTELRPTTGGHWRKHTSDGYKALRHLFLGIRDRRPIEHPVRAAATAASGAPDIARIAYHKLRKRFHQHVGTQTPAAESYRLFQMTEQVPNPESRVQIGTEKDALGQPRAQLHWRLQPLDTRSIQRSQQLLDRAVRRAGIGRVHVASIDSIERESVRGGYHHMGTTRMSQTPQDGVVDETCKIHGVDNAYIAGSSVFPTAGCANPTLTIAALSLRLADHLKTKLEI